MTVTPEDLVEIEAIKRLKYRYVRLLDLKEFDEMAELFLEDATASYSDGTRSFEGRDAILEFLRSALGPRTMVTSHKVHQPEIDLTGPDTATATWGLEAATYWLVGEGFGLGLAPAPYLGLCAAANLAIAAPSTSGGIGPFEFFARQVAVGFGAARGAATAYALVVHAVVLIPVVILGAVLLWRQHLGLGSLVRARERLEATAPGDG